MDSVLTLVAFGNCLEDETVNPVQINETEKVEPHPQSLSQIQMPIKEIDSIQESSPKTPEHEELTPIKRKGIASKTRKTLDGIG